MARYLTLLTLALVTATQTAQAFPSIIDNSRSFRPSHAESRNSIYDAPGNDTESYEVVGDYLRSQNELDRSLVRSYLLILEVAAEEDPALADAFESVLEMHLDDDATLEVMLVLIAMEEDFNQGDGSVRPLKMPLSLKAGGSVEFSLISTGDISPREPAGD
jgi:hypothetical protein